MPANLPALYLIDGSSQMYRAYHAIRGLTGPDGRPTNAVFGFVTMLRKLVTDWRPPFVAASFDLAGPTFREAISADYKANRPQMPPDLATQVPLVHRACEALGVPIVTCEGFEADDVIGTIAGRAARAGYQVTIVTGDKDLLQLVGDRVKVFNPRDEGTWYDAAAVVEKFGVPPERVADVLALAGDPVDNIRGVPGIGEKGARELIGAFGSLDDLLGRSAEVAQKTYREALLTHADAARESRELARIRTDVPIDIDLEWFRYGGPKREACFELFSELGFRSLVAEFAPMAGSVARDYLIIDSAMDLEALASEIRAAGRVAVKVLASDSSAMRAGVVGIACATDRHRVRYVPVGHTGLDSGGQLDQKTALAILGPVLADPAVAKIGHDLKFDTIVLAEHGAEMAGLAVDTMLAGYLLDATRSGHPVEDLAIEHLGYRAVAEDDVRGRGARARPLADLPATAVLDFAGERADLPFQLAGPLEAQLARDGLDGVYRELELPLLPVLVDIERAGIRVDTRALAALSTRIDRDLDARSARIFDLAGEPFNINSPKQLSEILFEKLKLPALKRTGKTRVASTAVEVLEELAATHDLPREVLEWRGLQKLKGTWVDALPLLVHPRTGRVHTSFNQGVAATGRLSSSDPNLQNIPIRTELGREIRSAFVADRGHVLISADYSQIELRVLAHLSGDEALTEAFRRGDDIHDQTALRVFGAASGLDRHELRRRAKIINYALLYGKTAFTLSRDIGVTPQAAQAFIDAYFAGFPGVRRFIDRLLDDARATGMVKTLFGRRRLVPEITSQNAQVRAAAERVSINLPVQGTAADILKRAMIDVHRDLAARAAAGRPSARMILTVHDELLFECPGTAADEVAAAVRDGMEHAVTLSVPLTVDIGVGDNWKTAKP
ncbi:MAG: DNA polymerase I [Acidobacteria bacterium]|nr:DNA polymerase I [Acidobacteriota bacterium]